MNDQLRSSRVEALFESALHDYEKQTGIPLAKHPLAEQLQNYQSVDSITTLLQEQARAFDESRGSDKIMKSLKCILSALSRVSAVATLGDDIGMSFPHAHAIHTSLGILLTAFKGVSADFDTLVELLESIELFLNRLDIYTKVPPTPAMNEIMMKMLVELLSTLALATKQIRQGRPIKFVKKLFGENGVEAVLQRLDRLTQEEARTTAAQTLGVVYGISQDMRAVVDANSVSNSALEILQEMVSEMNKSKREKLQQDVQKWLSPPDPWETHNQACGSRHTGTAAWFVEGDTLSEWKSSGPSSLLWVHGKPGAGKSVLCSTIIEDVNSMRKSGLASIAFFYCDFREDEKRYLRGLLSSVLDQLCHQSDSYFQILFTFYSEHANGSKRPSNDELMQCLKKILKVRGQVPVYLVIDGLDECSNTPDMPSPRENVLMLLVDLIESKIPNLRICVTSRPEFDIKVALEHLAFRSFSLHDEGEQRKDIEKYIRSVVNIDAKMRRWKPADRKLVIDVLIKKSDGMFRWVYCQICYLRCCLPACIGLALDELPETLDATYDRALRQINKANRELAYRLLQCVAVAFRPLEVKELAGILSFDFKTESIPKFREGWRLEDPVDAVLSTTSSLLAIIKDNQGRQVVQFSHYSVKEFLTSSRLAETNDIICRSYYISLTPAHTLTARACLGILLHLDGHVVSRDDLEEYPLAEYAAEYWTDHARSEGVLGIVEDGTKRLFDASKQHLSIWVWIYDPTLSWWKETTQAERPSQPKKSPLHYAAGCGLYSIVEFLVIQHPQDMRSRAFDDETTPLHLASRGGHENVVHLLLEHGADATVPDEDELTPLHYTSINGDGQVARLLLEHGADAAAQDKDGFTPLHLASQNGHEQVARLLLEHGADAAAQEKDRVTPLHVASQNGHDQVARLLLEHGAGAAAQQKDGWTPLHLASVNGHEQVARLLLELGADAAAQEKDGWTPLHLASVNGHEQVARLLLEHGADAAAQEKGGLTPLHLASLKGHEQAARLLLKHGADAAAQEEDGSTPLHLASRYGHEQVARLLLGHSVDATARQMNGWTPLHIVSHEGHKKVACLLLEHGADATAQIIAGWTSLHVAVRHGQPEVVDLFLEYGADVTTEQKNGSTLLHLASRWGHVDVARFLFEHGVEITALNKHGWSALHLASHWGHVEVARFLLGRGADPTI